MSLSDYSSDDSLDEEPVLGVEAIKSVARSARTGGPSSMNSSSRSVAAAALAGLAVAGIAAGSLLLRKYLKTSRPSAKGPNGQARGEDEPDASDKKEVRRKRPVGGDIKESPRQPAPFMTRTESTSSVGPLRKQPRRETSEDSEGGEASGPSPKGGTSGGHRRPLRKTPSANSRHRRPPRRSGNSSAGTGSESESNRASPAPAANREAASQLPAPAAAPAAPAAAADAKAVPPKAVSADPTDLMAAHRGAQQPAQQDFGAASAKSGGAVPKAESFPDLVAPTFSPTAQPSLDTFTAEMDVLDRAVETTGGARAKGGVENEQGDKKEGAVAASPADGKRDSAAATDGEKGAACTAEGSKEAAQVKGSGAAAAAADKGTVSRDAPEEARGTGDAAKSSSAVAEASSKKQDRLKDKAAGSSDAGKDGAAAGKEGTPAEAKEQGPGLVAAMQAEIDKQDDLPAAKDLVSPAVAENEGAAGSDKAAAAAAGQSASAGAKEPADPAAAATAGGAGAGKAGQGSAQGSEKGVEGVSNGAGNRALSAEPSLLPDARASAAGGGDALEEAAKLDLSSAEADAVSRAVKDAAGEPAGGVASAKEKDAEQKHENQQIPEGGDAAQPDMGSKQAAEKGQAAQEDKGARKGKGVSGGGSAAEAEKAAAGKQPAKGGKAAAGAEEASTKVEEAAAGSEEAGTDRKEPGERSASPSEAASANDTVHATVKAEKSGAYAAPDTLRAGAEEKPREAGSKGETGTSADAKAAAAFDPLGMDSEGPTEAPAVKEAGNGHVQGEAAGDDEINLEPQNQAESNVDLNLAVALRIISEKGNLAAAERTLQKSLGAVRDDSADAVRPHFRCRLAGTLADIIARAEQTGGAGGAAKSKKDSAAGRQAEIVELLTYAFEAAKEAGDGSLRARESWRLGAALAESEDFQAAHALFQAELAHWEERTGPADPRTQHSRTWLADILIKLDRKEEAYKLLTEAAQSLEEQAERAASSKPEAADSGSQKGTRSEAGADVPGHDLSPAAAASVTAAKCYVHLANLQDADEQYEAAAGNARKAVAIMEATFGEASPRTSTAYGTLASILKHEGKEEGLRKALGLYETLQGIAVAVHGLRNSHAAMGHRAVADVHLLLKECGEAVSHTEKAAQIAGSVHGRDHPVMESYWQAVAEAKQAAGDKEGAKDASRQALRVRSHSQRGANPKAAAGGGGRGGRGGGSAGRRGRGRR